MSHPLRQRRIADRRRPTRLGVWIAVLVALTLVPSGCVRRRLMVRSNPSDALVYVDNQPIGTTPCSVDFTYYGTREIRLVKPGYETLTVNQPIPTPWYEVPPLDFFSENLAFHEIQDNRTVSYNMTPQVIVPTQQLLDRANQLRQETLQAPAAPGAVVPASGVLPPPAGYGAGSSAPPAPLPSPVPSTGPAATYGPAPSYGTTPSYGPAATTPPVTTPFVPPQLPAPAPTLPPTPQQGQPLVSPPLR